MKATEVWNARMCDDNSHGDLYKILIWYKIVYFIAIKIL